MNQHGGLIVAAAGLGALLGGAATESNAPIVFAGGLVVMAGALSVSLASRTTLWIGVLSLAALLFTRPNILGEAYGMVGIALWIVLAISAPGPRPPAARGALACCAAALFAFWLYIGVVSVNGGLPTAIVVPSLIAGLGALCAGWFFSQSKKTSDLFGVILVAACAFQVAGYAVAAVYWRLAGFGAGLMTELSPAAFGGRGWEYSVWFPGVITTGSGSSLDWLGPRLTGWAGEPGIFAATLAFVGVTYRGRFRVPVILMTAAGVLFTQSTAGAFIYTVALLVALALERRSAAATVVSTLAASLIAIIALPVLSRSGLGLDTKQNTNAASVNDRLGGVGSVGELLDQYTAHPFGAAISDASNTSINLLKDSATFGPLVLVLAAAAILLPLVYLPNGRQAAPGALVLLLTITFAQPAFSNPLWLVLLGWLIATTAWRELPTSPEAAADQGSSDEGKSLAAPAAIKH